MPDVVVSADGVYAYNLTAVGSGGGGHPTVKEHAFSLNELLTAIRADELVHESDITISPFLKKKFRLFPAESGRGVFFLPKPYRDHFKLKKQSPLLLSLQRDIII